MDRYTPEEVELIFKLRKKEMGWGTIASRCNERFWTDREWTGVQQKYYAITRERQDAELARLAGQDSRMEGRITGAFYATLLIALTLIALIALGWL